MRYAPEPGFEPGSKDPQSLRISKLPHSGNFLYHVPILTPFAEQLI